MDRHTTTVEAAAYVARLDRQALDIPGREEYADLDSEPFRRIPSDDFDPAKLASGEHPF